MTRMNGVDLLRAIDRCDDVDLQPIGSVTCQIRNERGKIIDEETQPNFISKSWKTAAKGLLRQIWMRWGYNWTANGYLAPTTGLSTTLWPAGKVTAPRLPNEHIACWNDTTAEDAANEHMYFMPTGVVAWATRHPFSPGAGQRGQINTAESLMSDLLVRHVWDWLTNQGNGTFQSAGFVTLAAPQLPQANFGTTHRGRFTTAAITPGSLITGATAITFSAPWVDAAGKAWVIAKRTAPNAATCRIFSFDATSLNDSAADHNGVQNNIVGTLTAESAEFTAGSASNVSPGRIIGRDGTNTVFAIHNAASDPTGGATEDWGIVGSSGAATKFAAPGSTTGLYGGAVVGGSVYIGGPMQETIYKRNATTGAAVSSFACPAEVKAHLLAGSAGAITTYGVANVCTDGTDLLVLYSEQLAGTPFYCRCLARVSTTGTLLEIIGSVPSYQQNGWQETSTAPYSGTMLAGRGIWSHISWYPNVGGNTGTAPDSFAALSDQTYESSFGNLLSMMWNSNGYNSSMFVYDGGLYIVGSEVTSNTGVGACWPYARRAQDLGSRVLFGASKVKTSSDYMKLTYDVTLPGWLD